jgi:glycerate-2-kinase
MNPLSLINAIIETSIDAVKPENVIEKSVKYINDTLIVNNHPFDLKKYNRIFIVGSGKASIKMAKAVKKLIKNNTKKIEGLVISNYHEYIEDLTVVLGSHPIPTKKSVKAAKSLINLLTKCSNNDFLIYLLSGGSSALMELPKPPLTINDVQKVTSILLHAGLNIKELNFIRKKLSLIKGGKLNNFIQCNGVVLVLSDVIGDKLESIGSAPLYYKKEEFDIITLLNKYNLRKKLTKKVVDILTTEEKDSVNLLPHFIIGNNLTALKAAEEKALSYGLSAEILTSTLKGEAGQAGIFIASIGNFQSEYTKKSKLYILGGETTVTVKGSGMGGRNQELALAALKELEYNNNIYIAAYGTDGIDGPTDAAGAIINNELSLKAKNLRLSIEEYLQNNNSYNFFKEVGGHIKLGHTGTNVCDIVLLFIFHKEVNNVA